ncbi:hypothetical protein [Luteitalea sp.]|uniref:MOSC domain-containing protein n=1 Tax=Luteitalea sp. TaxID=2004800 RepID=UPI000A47B3A1|nr:hypothetical protein [Luteitalea sp.]
MANATDARATAHQTRTQLDEALDDVRKAPLDHGTVHLIVRRPVVETREVLDDAVFDVTEGLVGDSWHARTRSSDGTADPLTQITLMNVRAIGAISPDTSRWPLAGDQLFVDLDLAGDHLPAGTRLRIGDTVLEVTSQPHLGCRKFVDRFGIDAMKWVNAPEGRALNLRGIYAKVVSSGRIRRGDVIERVPVA